MTHPVLGEIECVRSPRARRVSIRVRASGDVRLVYPCGVSEMRALAFLEEIRAANRMARHNVYAYVLRGGRVRYTDDGEPAKTSGLPTLEAIRHAGVTDCVIVTTRYFGGTLLGTGGLVRAYGGAAALALQKARIVTMRVVVPGVWRVSYAQYEQALRILEECGAKLEDTRFGADVALCFAILEEGRAALCEKAREFCRGAALLEWQAARCAPF